MKTKQNMHCISVKHIVQTPNYSTERMRDEVEKTSLTMRGVAASSLFKAEIGEIFSYHSPMAVSKLLTAPMA